MNGDLTAAIIARDEERHVGACLDALSWTDELLVVLDDRTADRTAEIARSKGARVLRRRFTTFPALRNGALQEIRTPWVIFVDADERSTLPLAAEVRRRISLDEAGAPVGYWIPRRNFIWGGWIRHGGWYPDYQLRLLRVAYARYDEQRDVHELVQISGPVGYLTETLIHYNYDRVGQFLAKQRVYTTLDAERLAREGRRARPQNFALQPLREFRRRYVELEGHRDGWRGMTLAALLAWYTLVTYVKLARIAGQESGLTRRS